MHSVGSREADVNRRGLWLETDGWALTLQREEGEALSSELVGDLPVLFAPQTGAHF